MALSSINSDTNATDYFTQQNIRRAKRELLGNDLSQQERTQLRNQLSQAEKAAENGNTAYAEQLTGKVLGELNDSNPDLLQNSFEPETNEAESEKRTYQDDSDDSGVSFQNPTELNGYQAELNVRAHESEHVRRERWDAMRNGEVIQTQVRLKYSIDKNGKRFLAGGETIVRKRKEINYDTTKNLPKPRFSISG